MDQKNKCGGSYEGSDKNGVTYLTFPALDATGIVTHAFSTRMGGVSEGWYSTMNFSFTRGDNREHVLENYNQDGSGARRKAEKWS